MNECTSLEAWCDGEREKNDKISKLLFNEFQHNVRNEYLDCNKFNIRSIFFSFYLILSFCCTDCVFNGRAQNNRSTDHKLHSAQICNGISLHSQSLTRSFCESKKKTSNENKKNILLNCDGKTTLNCLTLCEI